MTVYSSLLQDVVSQCTESGLFNCFSLFSWKYAGIFRHYLIPECLWVSYIIDQPSVGLLPLAVAHSKWFGANSFYYVSRLFGQISLCAFSLDSAGICYPDWGCERLTIKNCPVASFFFFQSIYPFALLKLKLPTSNSFCTGSPCGALLSLWQQSQAAGAFQGGTPIAARGAQLSSSSLRLVLRLGQIMSVTRHRCEGRYWAQTGRKWSEIVASNPGSSSSSEGLSVACYCVKCHQYQYSLRSPINFLSRP